MKEWLLGFDVRMERDANQCWSIDENMWPTLVPNLSPSEGMERGLDPSFRQHLLANLWQAEDFLSKSAEGSVLLAITFRDIESNDCYAHNESQIRFDEECEKGLWQRLGYDVIDEFLYSAPSNAVDSPLAVRYGANPKTLLFSNRKKAESFSVLADKEVEDHAPWFVVSFWLRLIR